MLGLSTKAAIVIVLAVLLFDSLPLTFGYMIPTIIERSEQRSECEDCGDECDKCRYGHAVSQWCGVRECLKGPGEQCGGVNGSDKYGRCGAGMTCVCNKCSGCSEDTLDCYSSFCPEYHQSHRRRYEHPAARRPSFYDK